MDGEVILNEWMVKLSSMSGWIGRCTSEFLFAGERGGHVSGVGVSTQHLSLLLPGSLPLIHF